MIIGSGLLAQAFASQYSQRDDVCIFASGVSNSGCLDTREFDRERQLLSTTLEMSEQVSAFIYFGTCSVGDPEVNATPYVQHKLAMEQLAATHPQHLILRLPQIAGKTTNPHTLLNYLYERISRGECFELWNNAKRNIIDIDDVVKIASQVIDCATYRNITLTIANPDCYPIIDIVGAMERAVARHAIYRIVERGSKCMIDANTLVNCPSVEFSRDYLTKVVDKYHGK